MSKVTLKKILTVAAWIILIALLIFNLMVISLEKSGSSEYLDKVDISLLKVTGNSMEPTFHDGDIILARQVDYDKLNIDDIIVFEGDNELITHRIIQKDGTSIQTRGDNNAVPDGAITKDSYRTKVVCRVPLLGALWRIYSSKGLMIVWFLLLVMLLFGRDIFAGVYDLLNKSNKSSDK